jgi:preprotein translocase subunit SecG
MFKRRVIFGLVVCLLAVLIVGQTLSQPAQRGQAGGQRGGQRGGAQGSERPQTQGRQFDPEQMQKMMEQRMQRQVGASDAEWKTIGPGVMKVSELNRQVSGGGMGGMMGGRRGGPMGGQQGAQGQMTELDKATQQLETLLDNDSAKPEDIEKQLTVLRTAREKARKELAAEQQKLQKQVTVRQKAQLVLMGMLD